MRIYLFLFFSLIGFSALAQELYTFTEPASNMAAKSIGLRLTGTVMHDEENGKSNLHMLPEFMISISKKWMFHVDGFLSDRNGKLVGEGGSMYCKYRLFSSDDVHEHFRVATYSTLSFNNSDVHQEAIDFKGHNSGYEWGWVATRLKNKVAVSANLSWLHAFDNKNEIGYKIGNDRRDAMGFSLSVGKLFLPKEYTSYNQTNLNGMIEMIGQTNLSSGKTFLDVAPVLQFIIQSRMRVDLAYRVALSNDLKRTAPNGALLRFEYNFFNAF